MSDLNLGDLDLNLLVALDALLRERNVTRAAARMGISQSGMSHKLRHLRDYFGDPLLAPGRSGMVLTQRAEALAGPMRAALQQLARAIHRPDPFDPGSSTRRFVIAGADYGELVVMPGVMRRLSELAPGLEVVLEPPPPDLIDRLESGTIDLAIRPQRPSAAGLRTRKVLSEGFVVMAREGHRGLGRRLTLQTYCQLSHLLVNPGGGMTGIVDSLLAKKDLERHVALRIRHFVSAPFIVAESDLIWTAPQALARRALDYVQLATYKPPLSLPSVDSFMIWHERFQGDPGHGWLRELVVEIMGSVQR